ncbi:Transposase, ISXO2-like domain-containing protein [Strongyloides ratti]|uniref:Transposase, ISXO2-like domain-containing protein n=1 Tax=Strongyloides ratti TaxID=34506 RepID=A0A090KRP9_STRRB|nr:Transposase, ISXO2-like domain-containing protein [Strongyloides ratti]CEF60065.1 Transposase, ISXO2-like domain-containing protein [Strongyloides ratti]
MAYLWLCKTPVTSIISQCRHSSATICAFLGYFRQLVADALETEECVIGSVEKTEERRVSAVPVEKRDSETLLDVIKKHVKLGSIIHTDFWRGYERIEKKLGFKHCTVNHSVSFKDPDTGIHTNTIERT